MTTLEAPRRVLLGRWRFRMMILRAVLSWWPLALLPVAGLLWWSGRLLVLAGVGCIVAGVEYLRRGWLLGALRAAWWRSWWWADARAAGLVVIADPAMLNATHERGGSHAVGLELAPPLRRVRVAGPTRLYVLRSLPGQTLPVFERAVEALAHRWGAQVSVTEHPTKRRTIVLEVTRGDLLADVVRSPSR